MSDWAPDMYASSAVEDYENDEPEFFYAVRRGDKTLAETELNSDPQVIKDTYQGKTPLLYAIMFDQPEMVKFLLEKGASTEGAKEWIEKFKKDYEGQTLGSFAAFEEFKGGRRRRSRLNVKRRGTKRNGRSRKHRKLRKLTTRRR